MERARLRKSGKEVLADGGPEEPSFASQEEIIEIHEQTWGAMVFGWVRASALYFAFLALIMGILYIALAATIIFVAHVGGHTVLVARGTFVGGIANKNSLAYISESVPASDNPLTKLQNGFFGADGAAVVTIESGISDKLFIQNGEIFANGNPVGKANGFKLSKPMVDLNGQYLVRCNYGACTPGSYQIVDQHFVYGQVKRG